MDGTKTNTSSDTTLLPAMVVRALAEARRRALLSHKQSGDPIAIWRDGKVVVVPAEEIVVPPKEGE